MKNIQTRKNEVRFVTNDPKEMIGKYLAKRVTKVWAEDFVDEDTGEIVSIPRTEILFNSGKIIDQDLQAEIMFFISAEYFENVEVSNQKREAFLNCYNGLMPYMVYAQIQGKPKKFLLHASSVIMAHEIANDYIELNYEGGFYISQIKDFGSCTIIEESSLKKLVDSEIEGLKRIEDDENVSKEYYKIETNITTKDFEYPQLFVVKEKDVDTAKETIYFWLKQKFDEDAKEKNEEPQGFSVTIKSATIIPCSSVVEKEFSMAYLLGNE